MAAHPFWRGAANIVYRAFCWIFTSFTVALTLLAVLLLLASAFSDLISPTVWMVMPYLGLAFPVILVLSICWCFLLLITRRWKLTGVLVLTFLLCSPRIWRYCPMHFTSQEPITSINTDNGPLPIATIDTFKVLTFNTRALGDAHVNNLKEDLPVMQLVQRSNADVVLLQEYAFALTTGHTEQQLRNSMKKQYPYYHLLLNAGRKNMGIAIYSKWPIVKKEKIDKRDRNYASACYYELDVKGRRMAVVNCHLQNNSISKSNRKLYNEQATHFESDSLIRMEAGLRELIPSFKNRANQTGIINRFLNDREDAQEMPILICGDMNDTPSSFSYRSMRSTLGDAWVDAGRGPGITFKEAPFWFRIDHVFHSSHFHTLQARIIKEKTKSDHYPVLVTFQLLPTQTTH